MISTIFDLEAAPDRSGEGRLPYYGVREIPFKLALNFVKTHHYARGMHNGPTLSVGLFDGEFLIGACVFATPCSEAVRSSIFGPDRRSGVTELHRLVIRDLTPSNTESWFIVRALYLLRQLGRVEAVVSFSDEGFGHFGTIYQAVNSIYYGASPGQRAFLDGEGRLRHKRQCGVNITREEGQRRGWKPISTGRKHRYLLLLPRDRRHARQLRGELRIERAEYPRPLGVSRALAGRDLE